MIFNFKKNLIVIILLIIVIFTCAYLNDNKENFAGYTLGNRLNNLFYDNSRSNTDSKCILPALIEGNIQKYAIGFPNKNHSYKLSDNEIQYLDNKGDDYSFSKENQYIADNFPEQCNCYAKVTGSSGGQNFKIEKLDKSLTECSGVLYFNLSLLNTPDPPPKHYIDLLLFNKNNLSDDLTSVNTTTSSTIILADDINDALTGTSMNITNFDDIDFNNKYYKYLNIGLKFSSNKLFFYNKNLNEIQVNNFNFALNPSTNEKIPFVNSGDINFSLSDNEIENNMGISNTQSINNGLDSGLYIHDVANSNIDANSNNVGNNSNNVYNYPNQLNVEFENSLSKLLNNKRLSQINGYNHIRDHYVDGYIADGDERLLTDSRINSLNRINENEQIIDNQLNNSNNNNNQLNNPNNNNQLNNPNNNNQLNNPNNNTQNINGNKNINNMLINGRMIDEINTNNDLWFESAMNSKDNPIVNSNNMNNINDLLRSNCSNTLNNNNCLNQNINDCGSDINESCKNNYCCSKINCRENGTDKNNRELKHIHEHSHKKNNEYKGEEDNNNEIDDENSSGNNGSGNGGSGSGGSGSGGGGSGGSDSGGGGVFNNGRVGYNKNKTGNLNSNYQVNNNNRMNVNNNGYFNYNNVDSMANVRPLVADFSKF